MLDHQYSVFDAVITKWLFGHKCFNCGSEKRLEIDHHYPLSEGHGLSIKNAVLLCKSCNASKGSKMPKEFYSEQQLQELDHLLHSSFAV